MTYHLILHLSNRTETLLDQLVDLLQQAPPAPLSRLPFLIQGRGLEQWLSQQLAERFGIWSSGEFLFPSFFFDRLAEQLGLTLTSRSSCREQLRWRIEQQLRNPELVKILPFDLRHLTDSPRYRFRLAEQIAYTFDQYQLYRPEWLTDWQKGTNPLPEEPDSAWQMALWRALGLTPHRGELWLHLAERLEKGPEPDELPEQLFVFGINALPPLMVRVLLALSRHLVVHLFSLSPCQTYWSDLPGRTHWRTTRDIDTAASNEVEHHPLLVALGQQGAHFQALWLSIEEQLCATISDFTANGPAATLTDHLIRDLAANQVTAIDNETHPNLLFHRCHTRLREVEVLRDRIVALLRDHREVTPNQIVVMAPAIEEYRPFISALFADLPHTLADRTAEQDAPALTLLTDWLHLVAGPLGWDEVWDFLHQPPVLARFGWHESDLDALENLVVANAGARCGLDDSYHRNHWQAALDRLLLGAVFANDTLWGDVTPLPLLEGVALAQLAPLVQVVDLIAAWRPLAEPNKALLPEEWAKWLRDFAHFFFGDAPEGLPLFEAIDSWCEETEAVADLPLPLASVAAWAESLKNLPRHAAFLGHGITFCDLLPMRSVPVDYLFLLGMNDQRYPRPNRSPSFDLMRRHFRLGDRDLRAEDRYTFLELLLSVRRRLEIFWQGITPDTNELLPAAAVVEELRDVLTHYYRIDLDPLTLVHRAYHFHIDYFRIPSGPLPPGEDPDHYAVVCALVHQQPKVPSPLLPPLLGAHTSPPLPNPLSLAELADALIDPLRWRLTQLGIALPEIPAPIPARPLLTPDPLSEWRLREHFAAVRGKGKEGALLARLIGEGRWPLHPAAAAIAQQWLTPLELLAESFAQLYPAWRHQADLPETKPIHLPLPLTTLTHMLNSPATGFLTNKGIVGLFPHPLRGEKLLLPWLHHLLVNAAVATTATYLWLLRGYEPTCLTFKPLDREEAQSELAAWVELLAIPPLWQRSVWRAWGNAAFCSNTPKEKIAEEWQKASKNLFASSSADYFRDERASVQITALFGPIEVKETFFKDIWDQIAPRLTRWLAATKVTGLL